MSNDHHILQLASAYTKELIHNPRATVFENMERAVNNCQIYANVSDLLEVVQCMAKFDGRNNNFHLKQMACEALSKITGNQQS